MADKEGKKELEYVWRNIAHDLAAPLLALQGNLKLLSTELVPLLQEMYHEAKAAGLNIPDIDTNQFEVFQEMLTDSKLTAERLRQLISRWNYKVLSNGYKPSKQPINIKACIVVGVESYKSVHELEDKSRIHINLDDTSIVGDERMIQHILYEIFDNAEYAATSDGDDEHSVIIDISSTIDNGNYHLRIRNIGLTVDEADLPKLFAPYFTTKSSNIGLGLTFCQRAMQAMDGKVKCIAQRDGVEFVLTFPLAKR